MKWLSIVCIWIIGTSVAFAQADTADFNVRLLIGDDNEPPTTPVIISTTPIAATQIDVVWGASTDNFLVAGYTVSRDGVVIATTTQTNYSDTGLQPTTTYAYTVRAFDTVFNYSTSSATTSTTTLDLPPVPVPEVTVPPQATIARAALESFVASTSARSAVFTFETVNPARYILRWGRAGTYDLGQVTSEVFTLQHRTILQELEPGTAYSYELIGVTPRGIGTVLRRGKFATEQAYDTTLLVPNVQNFTAGNQDDSVSLEWRNPEFPGFSVVRIVRSHLGFPVHPNDGAIAYQGDGTRFTDDDILNEYSPVYYTAFVQTAEGVFSSGAVAVAFATDRAHTSQSDIPFVDFMRRPSAGTGEPGVFVPVAGPEASTSPEVLLPLLEDVYIRQGAYVTTMADAAITLSAKESFMIGVAAELLSRNVKTIIVTILDPTDHRQQLSFLLRLNALGTAYEATVAPVGVVGTSALTLEVYDFGAGQVGRYRTPLNFSTTADGRAVPRPVFPDAFVRDWPTLIALLLLPAVVAMWLVWWHRRREHE